MTAPPVGVYFTPLSNRLHTASSVHLGSNRAWAWVGSRVSVIPFLSALGWSPATACSSIGARGPTTG